MSVVKIRIRWKLIRLVVVNVVQLDVDGCKKHIFKESKWVSVNIHRAFGGEMCFNMKINGMGYLRMLSK